MAAITLPIKIEISDIEPVKTALSNGQEAYAILKTLFAVSHVADVRPCRSCKCPVLHMEHLSLDDAKALEERARTLLMRVEPEAYQKPEGSEEL